MTFRKQLFYRVYCDVRYKALLCDHQLTSAFNYLTTFKGYTLFCIIQ